MSTMFQTDCPSPSDLAAFTEGGLDPSHRRAITRHLLECEICYAVVRETAVVLAALEPPVRQRTWRTRRTFLAVAASLIVVVGLAVMLRLPAWTVAAALRDLASNMSEHRPFEARLAGFAHAPAVVVTRGAEGNESPQLFAAAAHAERRLEGRTDGAALHALGVAALVRGRHDDAIASLERAVEQTASAGFLSDLSAAYLARGRARGERADVIRAAELAERALGRDARFAPAAFNRALAIEAQPERRDEARGAWDAYLAIDDASAWADEARHRRDGLR